jgi:hypothetical protein
MVEFLQHGSESVKLTGNLIQYNNGFGVESYGARGINSQTNVCEGNGNSGSQEKISNDKNIIMQ